MDCSASSSILHSYPWYIGDWRNCETRLKLSMAERGLYRELLDHCYSEGSIPDDVRILARICGTSVKETKRLFPKIRDQFVQEGDRLVNPKASEVRRRLLGYHETRQKSGTAGARKRWAKAAELPPSSPGATPEYPSSGLAEKPQEATRAGVSAAYSTQADGSAIAEPKPTYSLLQPQPQHLNTNTCASNGDARVGALPSINDPPFGTMPTQEEIWFDEWWGEYWLHKAKKSARHAFKKNVRSESRFRQVMEATRAQKPEMLSRDPSKRPHGATWLNGERWEDELRGSKTAQPGNSAPPRAAYHREWQPPKPEAPGV